MNVKRRVEGRGRQEGQGVALRSAERQLCDLGVGTPSRAAGLRHASGPREADTGHPPHTHACARTAAPLHPLRCTCTDVPDVGPQLDDQGSCALKQVSGREQTM